MSVEWCGLPAWQQHALWMLTTKSELGAKDIEALINCLYIETGLLEAKSEKPTLFAATHLKSKDAADLRLMGISNINCVNRLAADGLTFAPQGLTVVYGDNGSGKTGYIRILRKACRSRIEKPQDLEILANIYGGVGGQAKARLDIIDGKKSDHVDWADGDITDARLSSLSVFDTRSAQLYVDEGNKLRFLPGDLDLPFRLNETIEKIQDILKPKLDIAKAQADVQPIAFEEARETAAQRFVTSLSEKTTDKEIEAACTFSHNAAEELKNTNDALKAGPEKVTELQRQAASIRTLAQSIEKLEKAFLANVRTSLLNAWNDTRAARAAHEKTKDLIAGKDPLATGSDAWEVMWKAAVTFAANVDTHHHFPTDGPRGKENTALCPLCQQESSPVSERLKRFQQYMSSTTVTAWETAASKLRDVQCFVNNTSIMPSDAEKQLIEVVRAVNAELANAVEARYALAATTQSAWKDFKGEGELAAPWAETDLVNQLTEVAKQIIEVATAVAKAQDPAERVKLQARLNELVDYRRISSEENTLKGRRDKLKRYEALKKCFTLCRTTEVTKQANKWVEDHLTKKAKDRFKEYLAVFRIEHLKVDLERTGTSTTPGYKNKLNGVASRTKLSDVLSEGEQRALSLAGFLTEAELERPGGTLIVDDPVSSMDRERSAEVAKQLVAQAAARQVIVFTHDIVFLQELGEAAKAANQTPVVHHVYARAEAGLLDPYGLPWKGQNIEQRLKFLTNEIIELKNLEAKSKTQYEYQAKAFYGRLRDAYERFVEEKLFHNVINRFRGAVQTRELRYVAIPDPIAKRFHIAFSKASLHSHDNPNAQNVTPPDTTGLVADLKELSDLNAAINEVHKQTEAARPEMKP